MILISTHDHDEYADAIATSPAGFIPKAQLSASAIQALMGSAAD